MLIGGKLNIAHMSMSIIYTFDIDEGQIKRHLCINVNNYTFNVDEGQIKHCPHVNIDKLHLRR